MSALIKFTGSVLFALASSAVLIASADSQLVADGKADFIRHVGLVK